jgi:hypothetical protein
METTMTNSLDQGTAVYPNQNGGKFFIVDSGTNDAGLHALAIGSFLAGYKIIKVHQIDDQDRWYRSAPISARITGLGWAIELTPDIFLDVLETKCEQNNLDWSIQDSI